MTLQEARQAVERLAKWRVIFTGWQLGTRSKDDPETQAVSDHREVTMLLRAEVSALVGLLVRKGVFTTDEFNIALGEEAVLQERDYQHTFPGARATDEGMVLDARAAAWMSKFPR